MLLRKLVLIFGLVKCYCWWVSLVVVNLLLGGCCCVWLNCRVVKLFLMVSELIFCYLVNFRYYVGIFSLFFRIFMFCWIYVRLLVIWLLNCCVYMVYCQVKMWLYVLCGCWSVWVCYLNMSGVICMSFLVVSVSVFVLFVCWYWI